MFRTTAIALFLGFVGGVVRGQVSEFDVFGTFERVPGCTSCAPNTTYPAFDTWVFEMRSSLPVGALSLDFRAPAGGFFDALPGTGYRDVAANPVQSNVEIPETFFLVPNGATPLSATLVDTTLELQSDYTTAAGLSCREGMCACQWRFSVCLQAAC